MARLIGPDESSREIKAIVNKMLRAKAAQTNLDVQAVFG